MLIWARRLVSIIFLAYGLCSPAFADTPSDQGNESSRLYYVLGAGLLDYVKAELLGDAEAQADLGEMYYYGYGVSRVRVPVITITGMRIA